MNLLDNNLSMLESNSLPLGSIIRKLMNKHGLKEADLARQVGLPQTTMNRLLIHNKSDPRINTLVPIAQFFGVTLGQLIGLEPIPQSRFHAGDTTVDPVIPKTIPVINWNAIIPWIFESERFDLKGCKGWMCTEKNISHKAFALDSMPFMEPRFRQGSKLVIDPESMPLDGSYVVVILQAVPTIRKVVNDGAEIYLKAFDPNMPMIPQEPQHKLIGTLVEVRENCL